MPRARGVARRVALGVREREAAFKHVENIGRERGQLVAVTELHGCALELGDLGALLRPETIELLTENLNGVLGAPDFTNKVRAEGVAHRLEHVPLDVSQ